MRSFSMPSPSPSTGLTMSKVELDHLEDASVAKCFADICRVMDAALNSGQHRPEFWVEFRIQLQLASRRAREADAQVLEWSKQLVDESLEVLKSSAESTR
jgi:hypothetical protein